MKILRLFNYLLLSLFIWGCASHEAGRQLEKDRVEIGSMGETSKLLPLEWWIVKKLPHKSAFLKAGPKPVLLQKADIEIVFQDIFVDAKMSLEFEPAAGQLTFNYPFLPGTVVQDFIMTIGNRKIRAVIMEESEAQEIYDAARKSGLKAVLVSQNEFNEMVLKTHSNKAESVKIDFEYSCTALRHDGNHKFIIPGFLNSETALCNVEIEVASSLKNFKSSEGKLVKVSEERFQLHDLKTLKDGLQFEFDFEIQERIYRAEDNGIENFVFWRNGKMIFEDNLNMKLLSKAVPLKGKSLAAVSAFYMYTRMKNAGLSSKVLIEHAIKNKLLTELTSQLVVDTTH